MHAQDKGLRQGVMKTNSSEAGELPQRSAHRALSTCQDRDFLNLLAASEQSKTAVADLSAAALQGVLNGVITGEGPAAAGRVHFSRTLDPGDAALCARILAGGGGAVGLPVTRREAEVLFD